MRSTARGLASDILESAKEHFENRLSHFLKDVSGGALVIKQGSVSIESEGVRVVRVSVRVASALGGASREVRGVFTVNSVAKTLANLIPDKRDLDELYDTASREYYFWKANDRHKKDRELFDDRDFEEFVEMAPEKALALQATSVSCQGPAILAFAYTIVNEQERFSRAG